MKKITSKATDLTAMTPCNDDAFLAAYLREELSESEDLRVQDHVGTCTACQQALERGAAEESLWQGLSKHLAQEHGDLSPAINAERERDAGRESLLADVRACLAPSDDPEMLGRLGHYEVRGVVGSGSTGVVLKAMEKRLGRYVAIKLMAPAYRTSGPARRRFEREGRAVAAVAHDHVVPIYSVDEYRGLPYIVMKYIPGLSLQERIDRDGPLDVCAVVRVGLQVARALSAAHAQGIVHRDVKPANVILEDNVDRAMVTDFGLARCADEATMTHSGTISGTPQYMSPEQARGDSVDARSDLFSLGSLLYAACTGHAPFRAQTLFGVIHRVSETEPRTIRESNARIDVWLEVLVQKLMAKRPEQRFQSADVVADVLASELAYLQNPTAVPVPGRDWAASQVAAPTKSLTRGGWLATGLAAAALATVALLVDWGGAAPQNPEREHGAAAVRRAGVGAVGEATLVGTPRLLGQDPQPRAKAAGESFGTWLRQEDGSLMQTVSSATWVAAGDSFVLRVHGGDVHVTASESDQVQMRAIRRIPAEVAADQDEVRAIIAHEQLRALPDGAGFRSQLGPSAVASARSFVGAKFDLAVPPGVKVLVQTGNGGVDVSGVRGSVTARAFDGHILIANVHGDVEVETLRGDISIDGCTGEAEVLAIHGNVRVKGLDGGGTIRTSRGDVWLGECAGKIYAQTAGGGIVVRGVQGPTGAFASGGDVEAFVTRTPSDNCRFSTSNGQVVLHVAPGVNVDIEAAGAIDSDFALVPKVYDGEPNVTWQATHPNGDRPRLRATSPSGRVLIRRLAVGAGDPQAEVEALASGEIPRAVARGLGAVSGSGPGVSGPGVSGPSGNGPGSSGPGASGPGVSDPGASGSGPSGSGGSASGGKNLGGSGLGGSGLGGSGSGGSGKGGSGPAARAILSAAAIQRTTGKPRPGGLATVELPDGGEPDGGEMDGYTIYLPASHAADAGPYPVLVYLQGAYGVGGEIASVNNWGLTRLLRDETDLSTERNRMLLDQFIVVSPHIQGGYYHDHPEVVREILDDVFASYQGDATRVYLTGLSSGGHGSWGLADRMPNTFAAIAPISGRATGVRNWGSLKDTSIWVSHNVGDGIVDFEFAADAVANLERALDVKFERFDRLVVTDTDYLDHRYLLTSAPTDSHDAWSAVYSSAEFYRWLLKQTRAVADPLLPSPRRAQIR